MKNIILLTYFCLFFLSGCHSSTSKVQEENQKTQDRRDGEAKTPPSSRSRLSKADIKEAARKYFKNLEAHIKKYKDADLVFEGTVEDIYASPLENCLRNWVVVVNIQKVTKGSFSGYKFEFRVHSPSISLLEEGKSITVRAKAVDNAYEIDQFQWSYPGPEESKKLLEEADRYLEIVVRLLEKADRIDSNKSEIEPEKESKK